VVKIENQGELTDLCVCADGILQSDRKLWSAAHCSDSGRATAEIAHITSTDPIPGICIKQNFIGETKSSLVPVA